MNMTCSNIKIDISEEEFPEVTKIWSENIKPEFGSDQNALISADVELSTNSNTLDTSSNEIKLDLIKEDILKNEGLFDNKLEFRNIKNLELINNSIETTNTHHYKCENCYEFFQEIELYEFHKYVHNPAKICPHCKRSYKAFKSYRNHIEDHLKNYIKCEYCPKIFFGKKIYISHISWHKKEAKLYDCSYCKKSFSTKKQKVTHERIHTKERPYKCKKCDKSFTQASTLKTHMNTHVEEKMYSCETCQGTFATLSSLKRHIKRIHARGRAMSCKLCQEEFFNRDSFSQHRIDKHPNTKKYFRVCPVCDEEFMIKQRYLIHRKMHREKGELEDFYVLAEPVKEDTNDLEEKQIKGHCKCVLCGTLVQMEQYYYHQNKHLGMTIEEVIECEKTSKYPCKQCENVLTTRKNAFRHMDTHLDKTYFCVKEGCTVGGAMTYMSYIKHDYNKHQKIICKKCRMAFVGYFNFARHRRANHFQARKRTYICKWCSSTFTTLQLLTKHYNFHNKMNIYNCYTCNRKFPGFINFKKHMSVVHNDVPCTVRNFSRIRLELDQISFHKELHKKKFYCSVCKVGFEFRNIFEEHERKHFSIKYQCKECEQCFANKINYLSHLDSKICNKYLAEVMLAEVKSFTCSICKKELKNVRSFTKHMVNVHVQGDYHCRYCISHFNSLDKLRCHLLRMHPKDKKYFCTLCDAGFITFREFISHQKFHKKRRQIKRVLCKITLNNLAHRKVKIKQEFQSDEECDVLDVPEKVVINENGDVVEC